MFFAGAMLAPSAAMKVENASNARRQSGRPGGSSEEVQKLQYAISLPTLMKNDRTGRESRSKGGPAPSVSLPRLGNEEDKRIEVEMRQQKLRRRQKELQRNKQQKHKKQQRAQREFYAQKVRNVKQQRNRGLKERQDKQFEHNAFSRKEIAEKDLADKVNDEAEGISEELQKVAEALVAITFGDGVKTPKWCEDAF